MAEVWREAPEGSVENPKLRVAPAGDDRQRSVFRRRLIDELVVTDETAVATDDGDVSPD
jgi:hypothetical protein